MNNSFLQFLSLIKKSGKMVEGYNKCEEVIQKRKIQLLLVSDDCSINTKEKFKRYCSNNNVPVIECYTGDILGRALGRDKINIVGILDGNMSEKLIKLWEQNVPI